MKENIIVIVLSLLFFVNSYKVWVFCIAISMILLLWDKFIYSYKKSKYESKRRIVYTFTFLIPILSVLTINIILFFIIDLFLFKYIDITLKIFIITLGIIASLTVLFLILALMKIKSIIYKRIKENDAKKFFEESNDFVKNMYTVLAFWLSFLPTALSSFWITPVYQDNQEIALILAWFILTVGIVYSVVQLNLFRFKFK